MCLARVLRHEGRNRGVIYADCWRYWECGEELEGEYRAVLVPDEETGDQRRVWEAGAGKDFWGKAEWECCLAEGTSGFVVWERDRGQSRCACAMWEKSAHVGFAASGSNAFSAASTGWSADYLKTIEGPRVEQRKRDARLRAEQRPQFDY